MDNGNNGFVCKRQKKAKKKMLIAIVIIATVMALLILISLIIDSLQVKDITFNEFVIDYNFYPANFEENIFEDEKYLELISAEFLRFCDARTNLTLGFTQETASAHGEDVVFLTDMIYDIINGDCDSYNNKFSDEYYQAHQKKEPFTMQKVYDVILTYVSEETAEENNVNYTKYYYIVEYKIYQNNGTFRRDIGDGSKKQYFTLSDRDGKLLVDNISYTPHQ